MTTASEVRRRQLVAIATGKYDAFPPLDVDREVAAVRTWLTDPSLGDRAFSDAGEESLAAGPTYADVRARFAGATRFTDAYALVVYVTGHGVVEKGRHWLVLHDSAPGEMPLTAVATADLISWLGSYDDMSHVLLVIDVCQAGAVTSDVTAELTQDLPANWCVLLTVPGFADAKVGAFTGVLSTVLDEIEKGAVKGVDADDEYIPSDVLIRQLRQRLLGDHRQKLVPLVDPYAPTACLPNPGYDATRTARVTTTEPLADLALLRSDLDPVWEARAPVMSASGAAFTGRRMLLSEIISSTQGPPGVLVVAGRAGSGKSAAIARVVTCSDPAFRREHAETLAGMAPLPEEGVVDVAIVATGKTPHQLAKKLAALLGVPTPVEDALEYYVDAITRELWNRPGVPTLVVDALDEGSDPNGFLLSVLGRIVRAAGPKIRLVLGVRSSADQAAGQGDELADLATALLGARRVDVDSDALWEEADLQAYVARILAEGQAPSDDHRAVAELIAARTGRSFLLAGLVAQRLAGSEYLAQGTGARLLDKIDRIAGTGVHDLVVDDIAQRYADPERRDLALVLLRAASMSFGRGIPRRELWAKVATAIATGREVTQEEVAWFVKERASGYLMRDTEDGEVVYRPFHDLLRSELVGRTGAVVHEHAAITRALASAYTGFSDG